MPERYKVVIRPEAKKELRGHIRFLAAVNEAAAKRLLTKVNADIRSLSKMPHRYPIYNRPDLEPGKYRRMVSSKHYLVIYHIVENTVYIGKIQDGRRGDNIITG
ncbi:plasmid stabilization protein [Clostridia bacterium]|nr:plasmid stabilization protein [Clostridia bacterium]